MFAPHWLVALALSMPQITRLMQYPNYTLSLPLHSEMGEPMGHGVAQRFEGTLKTVSNRPLELADSDTVVWKWRMFDPTAMI
jgi:hypothetical protein